MSEPRRTSLLTSASALAILCLTAAAAAQQTVPDVVVLAPAEAPAGNRAGDRAPSAVQNQERYSRPIATSGTKTSTPIKEVPQAIRVVPVELLEDQGATSVNDVLRNTAAVAPVQNRAGTTATAYFGQLLTRGFRTDVYRDGVRQRFFFDVDSETLYNTSSVEFLKGPGSQLYGLGAAGGLINFISKTPQSRPSYTILTSVGEIAGKLTNREGLDLTGPLNADGTLSYRLMGDFERSALFEDSSTLTRKDFGAAILWDNKRDTTVKLDVDARDRRQPLYTGLPFTSTKVQIPITRFPGEPNLNFLRNSGVETTLDATHQFDSVWSSRTVLRYDYGNYHFAGANAKSLQADGVTLNRSYTDYKEFYNEFVFEQDVTAKTMFLGHPATTLLGLEYDYLYDRSGSDSSKIGALNLLNPVYGVSFPKFTGSNYPINIEQNNFAVYFQQQIQPIDRLHLTAGVRFDVVSEALNAIADGGNNFTTNNNAATYRLGGTYDIWGPVAAYASYATSFTPNTASLNQSDEVGPLPPETGDQYEIGLKWDDNRFLSGNLGLFQITRSNVAVPDPTSDIGAYRISGKQRSRGVDLDATLHIAPGFSATASYAYVYANVLQDTANPVGALLNNVPRHQASVWGRYDFTEGPLNGAFLGTGVAYVGERPGDLANTFKLGAYTTVDALAGWRWKSWTAQVNVKNLFDHRYYVYADRPSRVYPGEPRSVMATLKFTY